MRNWSVNVPCLASFLMLVVIAHAVSLKHELTDEELISREVVEWRLERNKAQQNQMLKSNSCDEHHGKKSVEAGLKEHKENKNATIVIPLVRTIFDVLQTNSNPCPKDQKVDHTGNCRQVFAPSA